MFPGAEQRGAAQDQATTPPCTLAASHTFQGSAEPGQAETGYGALQTSTAEKPAIHMADVIQGPSTGCRGMPAASSATGSATPDAVASQGSALPGGAIPDSHREQPQPSEPVPARLACLEAQAKPPAPLAHNREGPQIEEGMPVPLMGTLLQARLLTDARQPEAILLGVESSTSTSRQDAALLQTEGQALSQLSAVTAGDTASATAGISASPEAAGEAPMASQNRQGPEYSSADDVRSQVSALPASTRLPQTDQQALGQDSQKAAESSDKASGYALYPAVHEAAAANFTVSAAVAQPPPDDQLGRSPTQDAVTQMPVLDSASRGASTDDCEHISIPLQVVLDTIQGALLARYH